MPTLNERAHELCNAMVADADRLGIAVSTLDCGTRIIDCGVKAAGSIEAGRRLAEVCLAGLGGRSKSTPIAMQPDGRARRLTGDDRTSPWRPAWRRSMPAGKSKARSSSRWALARCGPLRAAKSCSTTSATANKPDVCVGVLETSKLPPDGVCIDIAEKCGITPEQLTLLVARTASPAGTVQIVARSVETALHKLHVLGLRSEPRRQRARHGPAAAAWR